MPFTALDGGILVSLALAAGVSVLVERRALSAAAAAKREAEAAPSRPIEVGAAWVSGSIAPFEGAPLPRVVLYERGRDELTAGDAPRIFWTEVRRERAIHPFVLVTSRGQRVLVEPPSDAVLRAPITVSARTAPGERERATSIAEGMDVLVYGRLVAPGDGGYRTVGADWRLLPPPGGPMQIVAEPLEAPHERRAAFSGRVARELAVSWVVVALLLLTFTEHRSPGPLPCAVPWAALIYAAVGLHRWRRSRDWYESTGVRSVERGRPRAKRGPKPADAPLASRTNVQLVAETNDVGRELSELCERMRRVDRLVPMIVDGELDRDDENRYYVVVNDAGYHVWVNGRSGGRSTKKFATREELVFHVMASQAREAGQAHAAIEGATGVEAVRVAQAHTRELLEAARPGWSERLGQRR